MHSAAAAVTRGATAPLAVAARSCCTTEAGSCARLAAQGCLHPAHRRVMSLVASSPLGLIASMASIASTASCRAVHLHTNMCWYSEKEIKSGPASGHRQAGNAGERCGRERASGPGPSSANLVRGVAMRAPAFTGPLTAKRSSKAQREAVIDRRATPESGVGGKGLVDQDPAARISSKGWPCELRLSQGH